MLANELRGRQLALLRGTLRSRVAVYVEKLGGGPGQQQGVHASEHLELWLASFAGVRRLRARASLRALNEASARASAPAPVVQGCKTRTIDPYSPELDNLVAITFDLLARPLARSLEDRRRTRRGRNSACRYPLAPATAGHPKSTARITQIGST